MYAYPGKWVALTISDQDFSVNQVGAGFGCGFERATPPVKKNTNKSSLTSFWIIT